MRTAGDVRNPFLSRVAVTLRQGRPLNLFEPSDPTIEQLPNGPLMRLWFTTAGCQQDRRGACTMCNYGTGPAVTADAMVTQVSSILARCSEQKGTLLVSPSGSMFDPREVPPRAMLEILRLVTRSNFETILTETRPETVTPELTAEVVKIMQGRKFAVEMGLESSCQLVLTHCVNKMMGLDDWDRAAQILAGQGIPVTANVSIGTAFLSLPESIADAVSTVQWALMHGSDDCIVFPLLVRDWTVLAHLWRKGRYQPPSLWSLVEVLSQTGADAAGRVSIAWYRDYDDERGGASQDMAVLAVPTTCPRCRLRVVEELERFRATGDFAIVDSLTRFPCSCHSAWRQQLETATNDQWQKRLPEEYERLGKEVLGDPWWQRNELAVLQWLEDSLSR